MLGNLTAIREMSRNWPKVTEMSELFAEESCRGKLFIVNVMFGATPVFSSSIIFLHCIIILLLWLYFVIMLLVYAWRGKSQHEKSAVRWQGNVVEFQVRGHPECSWSSLRLLEGSLVAFTSFLPQFLVVRVIIVRLWSMNSWITKKLCERTACARQSCLHLCQKGLRNRASVHSLE